MDPPRLTCLCWVLRDQLVVCDPRGCGRLVGVYWPRGGWSSRWRSLCWLRLHVRGRGHRALLQHRLSPLGLDLKRLLFPTHIHFMLIKRKKNIYISIFTFLFCINIKKIKGFLVFVFFWYSSPLSYFKSCKYIDFNIWTIMKNVHFFWWKAYQMMHMGKVY